MTAQVLGRELEIEGVLSKTCEKCDGDGVIEYTRDATLNDLTDMQVRTLLQADIFRESGGRDEEDMEEMRNQAQNPQSGYSRGPSPSGTPSANPSSF